MERSAKREPPTSPSKWQVLSVRPARQQAGRQGGRAYNTILWKSAYRECGHAHMHMGLSLCRSITTTTHGTPLALLHLARCLSIAASPRSPGPHRTRWQVLFSASLSGELPPLTGPGVGLSRGSSAPGISGPTRAKSLAPRIAELSTQLASGHDGLTKTACCELALLASRSISACMAVADAKLEPQLGKVLQKSTDPTTQCWAMSVLSNCASAPGSRERQAVAVPALCALITSPVPEVQHAATLHLATLSHSASLTTAISGNRLSMNALRAIEGKSSTTLAAPSCNALRQEASQYARWALRTAQGRNYKPAFVPKSQQELEDEASVQLQARVRSSFVANQYRNEMKARRAAAAVVQATYRGHQGRSAVATQLLIEGPAAALMQSVIRGRKQRKAIAEQAAKQRAAAASVSAPRSGSAEPMPTDGMVLNVLCADGDLQLSLSAGAPTFAASAGALVTIPVRCIDGSVDMGVHIDTIDGNAEVSAAVEDQAMTLFLEAADGPLRVRLNVVN